MEGTKSKNGSKSHSFKNQPEDVGPANRISYWRKRNFGKPGQCLTQKELAKLIGRSVSMVGRYERGNRKPTLNVLFKLAAALQVPPHVLYSDLWEQCNEVMHCHRKAMNFYENHQKEK